MTLEKELPIPPHYDPEKVGEVWKVHYEEVAKDAMNWAKEYNIRPASKDEFKV